MPEYQQIHFALLFSFDKLRSGNSIAIFSFLYICIACTTFKKYALFSLFQNHDHLSLIPISDICPMLLAIMFGNNFSILAQPKEMVCKGILFNRFVHTSSITSDFNIQSHRQKENYLQRSKQCHKFFILSILYQLFSAKGLIILAT